MKTIWDARKKIIGVIALVLLMLLMMNLNSRLSEYFRLSSTRDKLGVEVDQLKATKMALDTQVAYATSDQAVEEWARNEAHLARPGDKVIIPVTPVGQTPVPEVQATPTVQPVNNWQIWWALFFRN
jgi:cell division protein FtsB